MMLYNNFLVLKAHSQMQALAYINNHQKKSEKRAHLSLSLFYGEWWCTNLTTFNANEIFFTLNISIIFYFDYVNVLL